MDCRARYSDARVEDWSNVLTRVSVTPIDCRSTHNMSGCSCLRLVCCAAAAHRTIPAATSSHRHCSSAPRTTPRSCARRSSARCSSPSRTRRSRRSPTARTPATTVSRPGSGRATCQTPPSGGSAARRVGVCEHLVGERLRPPRSGGVKASGVGREHGHEGSAPIWRPRPRGPCRRRARRWTKSSA